MEFSEVKPVVDLKVVQNEDKELLYNLLQKYLYEMTKYYCDDIDANGNYPYRFFEDYFTDSTRKALFICRNDNIAGFVLLNGYSHIGEKPDHAIAEFCILPKYRKSHLAKRAFEMLCKAYPGKWEIKYCMKNTPAAQLWNRVTKQYDPIVYRLEDGEAVISFDTNQD